MTKYQIKVRIDPRNIYILDDVIEGYDGLGLVTTINAKMGEVVVHVTPDTYDDIMAILQNFPCPITII